MKKEIRNYIVSKNIVLLDAMKLMNSNGKPILFVVNEEGHLCGSLTDGDIRRWLLDGGGLCACVSEIAHKDTISSTRIEYDFNERIIENQQLLAIPIVDENQKVIDVQFRKQTIHRKNSDCFRDTDIVIMAGGKGTRLQPYTKIIPKPLIPIGDKPILEWILDKFSDYGGQNFFITVNYKKEIIKSYFGEIDKSYKIHYIDEEMPLGTAGGIALIGKKFSAPVVITNCDILVEAEYDDLIKYHVDSQNDMTIVSSMKDLQIPYGVLHSDECGVIISMEEKPRLPFYINTGMYVVNPEFISWIPRGRVYHMTDLAEEMIRKGRKVAMYPIDSCLFFDMGEFEEMKRMEDYINERYSH